MSFAVHRPIPLAHLFQSAQLVSLMFRYGLTSALAFSVHSALAQGATWEQQAERLQNVSATLLDAFPVGEPIAAPLSLEVRSVVSFLPKANPRVGTKSEKVPTSPVHTVPTLQLNGLVFQDSFLRAGLQGWAGYLPAGAEKLFGLKAELEEWVAGASVQAAIPVGKVELVLPLGAQWSDSNVTGAITADNSRDEFSTRTRLVYVAPGVRVPAWSSWANMLLAAKKTESRFKIPIEGTNLALVDELDDAQIPVATQVSAGYMHHTGVQVGASQLHVPNRLSMPRVFLSYQYAFR